MTKADDITLAVFIFSLIAIFITVLRREHKRNHPRNHNGEAG
jgi:hypothetical protein